MAQHDHSIANDTGANVRADINNALSAIVSQNSGASAPTTTFALMWWFDTTNNLLKQRDESDANWVTLGSLVGTTWKPYHGGTETALFETADETKLDGIAAGAEVNPDVVPQAEAEAGTATTERIWTAERVKQAIDALGVTDWTNSGAIDLTSGSPTSVSLLSGVSGVNEIEIYITGVSTNANNQAPMIQIGDSGGLETSGYNGFAGYNDASTDAGTANSSGFLLAEETRFDAGNSGIFLVRLKHMGSNFWAMESAVGNRGSVSTNILTGIGDKTLSDVLTQLTITTSGGTATFDGGTAYVRYR